MSTPLATSLPHPSPRESISNIDIDVDIVGFIVMNYNWSLALIRYSSCMHTRARQPRLIDSSSRYPLAACPRSTRARTRSDTTLGAARRPGGPRFSTHRDTHFPERSTSSKCIVTSICDRVACRRRRRVLAIICAIRVRAVLACSLFAVFKKKWRNVGRILTNAYRR